MCWLGHILRLEKIKTPDGEGECERLIKVAVKHQHSEKYVGSLLMDAPDMTWEELTAKAEDKKAWRKLVKQLKPTKPWTKTVASDESDEDESCLYKPGPGETAPEQQWDSLTQLQLRQQLQLQFPRPRAQYPEEEEIIQQLYTNQPPSTNTNKTATAKNTNTTAISAANTNATIDVMLREMVNFFPTHHPCYLIIDPDGRH